MDLQKAETRSKFWTIKIFIWDRGSAFQYFITCNNEYVGQSGRIYK